MFMLTRFRLAFQQIETRLQQILGVNGPQTPALAYDVLDQSQQSEQQDQSQSHCDGLNEVSSLLDSIFGDGFLWAAVPKSKITLARRHLRKNAVNKIKVFATPKKNIVACLECGHWHEMHTICGNCYDKVRQETQLMRDTMNQDVLKYDHPHSEVVYLYQDEKDNRPMYKGKYIVEMEKKRPEWWPENLLTKAQGRHQ